MLVDLPSRAGAADAHVAVLFVHAMSLSAHCYDPLAAALSAHGLNVGVELPGHGGAPESAEGQDPWMAFADAVALGVRELRGRTSAPILVAAHSGGATAALLAQQQAELGLLGLYLYEPATRPPAPPSPRAAELIAKTKARPWIFSDRTAARAHAETSSPSKRFHAGALEGYLADGFTDHLDGSVRLACRPDYEAEVYRHAPINSCWQDLPSVHARVLLAAGNGGHPGGLGEVALELVRHLPNASLDVLDGVGHFAPCEKPALLAASLDAFVADLLTR